MLLMIPSSLLFPNMCPLTNRIGRRSKWNIPTVLVQQDGFLDSCDDERLHIHTGPARFSKFCEVLGQDLQLKWDQVRVMPAFQQTIQGFLLAVLHFIGCYIRTTSGSR